ncbi:MAG: FMN-binding protein [Clostridia bacterium]|nr:FMN-binding protein [Clostridia bacterium]
MSLLINMGFAWISVILAFFLSIIYVLRIASRNKGKLGELFGKINRGLRKHHKYMGMLLVLTGFIHGLFSTQKVWSFNLGTIAWVVSILLGINWMVRKYVGKSKGWMFYHRLLTVVFIGTIVWHVIDVGGIQVHKLLLQQNSPNTTTTQIEPSSISGLDSNLQGRQFKDGVFTGEADGFRPGLKVSVEIKDNQIISIQVTEHNEVNSRFYARPIQIIPQEIIVAQSTEVDTISGATFTSVGIINAVNNALSQALISGELPQNQELPQNSGRHGRFSQSEGPSDDFPRRRH